MTTPFPGEPNQVSFQGKAVQIWAGTGKAGTPVLLLNQDQANTVTVNYRPNVIIGDSNAVPIGPQSSFTMDGGRTIYAIAPSGTAPLLVIPGGGSFFQRITSITIPTGATSGQRIVINGLTGTITGFDAGNNVTFILSPAGLEVFGTEGVGLFNNGSIEFGPDLATIVGGFAAMVAEAAAGQLIVSSGGNSLVDPQASVVLGSANSSGGSTRFSIQATLTVLNNSGAAIPLARPTGYPQNHDTFSGASWGAGERALNINGPIDTYNAAIALLINAGISA